MSSNTIVGLTSPINSNDLVTKYYVDKNFIYGYENIAEKIEKLGNTFLRIGYEENKDRLFSEIGFIFRGLAFDLRSIKNDLKN